MSILEPFPVVLEKPLPVAERAWHGGKRWQQDELPSARPGVVFVFTVRGEQILRQGDGPLRMDERYLVNATVVTLVDIRPRTLTVEILLEPPEDKAPALLLTAGFRCRVTDPAIVAQLGFWSVFPDLDAYLRANLRPGGTADEIQQRLLARFAICPPEIIGMQIRPVSVRLSIVEE
jgi:hypothetical protein